MPRSAAVLACAWPLSLHAAILSGRSDWALGAGASASMTSLIDLARNVRRVGVKLESAVP